MSEPFSLQWAEKFVKSAKQSYDLARDSFWKKSPYCDLDVWTETLVEAPASLQWNLLDGRWLGRTPFIWSLPPVNMEVAVVKVPTSQWLQLNVAFTAKDAQVKPDLDSYRLAPVKFVPGLATRGEFRVLWYNEWPRWYDLERDVGTGALLFIETALEGTFTLAVGEIGVAKDILKSCDGTKDAICHVFRGGGQRSLSLEHVITN